MTDHLSLDIVVVNWNSRRLLRDCLASLAKAEWEPGSRVRVVVVDNGSSDGSLDGLDAGPLNLEVVRNLENRGFAAACNQGAARSGSDALLFLNPDTRVEPGSVVGAWRELRGAASRGVGIIGLRLTDGCGRVARSCARFPTLATLLSESVGLSHVTRSPRYSYRMEEWAHDETRVVDHVMGAFFLMKRSLFEALGGFDERFFVYFEDLDFSRRAFEAGWASLYWTGSCIWHLGGGSSRRVLGMRLFYSLRSRLIYARKHHGPRAFALISFSTLLVEPFLRLLRSPASTVSLIEAYSRLVVWFFSADARRVLGSPR